MRDQFPFELHHGDCKGADAEANAIFNSLRSGTDERIMMHPQLNSELRAFCAPHPLDEVRQPRPPLKRNQDIVDETDRLVACPRDGEQQRSGTWSTIRKALKAGKQVTIVWPDGNVTPSYERKAETARGGKSARSR
ncbi:MAG: hypothetical protein H0U18_08830 [Pyrinomonadaceae bacterium]|nr:hypothetical protein [Pyrinomonadaceae bacterium]